MRASIEFLEFPVKKNPNVVELLRPGAFKAATYGRLTGKPGICISVLGPGMLNFCFISRVRYVAEKIEVGFMEGVEKHLAR